jgi:hypothetical protein
MAVRLFLLGPVVPLERWYVMNDSEQVTDKSIKTIIGAVLLLWLVLTFILGANDAFARGPGALPLSNCEGTMQSGMEKEVNDSYDLLDRLLEKMKQGSIK